MITFNTNNEIADILEIGEKTVEREVSDIQEELLKSRKVNAEYLDSTFETPHM